MRQRFIAGTGVGAIGMGVMPMSFAEVDTTQAIDTIHAALDAGVALLDTADTYTPSADQMGHNERITSAALACWSGDRDRVLLATKGGHYRTPENTFPVDGRPEYIRRACEHSLRALDVDCIDLYQYHRPDPSVPFVETMGAFAELRREGKIRLVGISNVSIGQIREAMSIVEIATVQNHFSPDSRASEPVLRFCAEQGIAFLPYSPFGGMWKASTFGERHPAFTEVARRHGVSPQRVALAWCLATAPNVIPIPGARRRETILDSAAAAELELTADDLAELDSPVPVG